MKKICIAIIGIMVLCLIGYVILKDNKSPKEQSKQLFNIDISEYELIEEKNTLSKNKYGGSYDVKIKVEEEQIDTFLEKISKEGYGLVEGEKDSDYSIPIKNITGMEYSEKIKVYPRLSSVQRKIKFAEEPKGITSFIICFENPDGFYEVYMSYSE